MRESTRKYKLNNSEERFENKRQLLGFEDVNFEQRREPYNERARISSNNQQQKANRQPEGSNR